MGSSNTDFLCAWYLCGLLSSKYQELHACKTCYNWKPSDLRGIQQPKEKKKNKTKPHTKNPTYKPTNPTKQNHQNQPRFVPTILLNKNCSELLGWDTLSNLFVSLGPLLKKAKCERSKIAKWCYCFVLLSPQLLIKLKTKTNTDYFLECCSREERDSWALDITGAIHAGHPVQVQELHRMKNSFKLLENISLQ